MQSLDDKIYKFVIAGRIILIATLILTLVLLSVMTTKSNQIAKKVSMQNPDAILLNQTDEVDVPITGERDSSEDVADSEAKSEAELLEKAEEKENIEEEKKEEEKNNQHSEPSSANISTQQIVRPTTPAPKPTQPSKPAQPTQPTQPQSTKKDTPVIDYNEIRFVDDNSDQLKNTDWLYTETVDDSNTATTEEKEEKTGKEAIEEIENSEKIKTEENPSN